MSGGICRICGCTEELPCVDEWGEPCSWSVADPSICTFCDEGVPYQTGGDREEFSSFAGSGSVGFVRGRR